MEKKEKESGGYKVHRTEVKVGISEYVSELEGFSGTLKQRYSDFVVNERDFEGKTVHLTDTALPAEFIKERLESSVLLVEAIKKLEDLVKGDDKTVKVVVEVEDDKERRTLVHREIREKFPMLGEWVFNLFCIIPENFALVNAWINSSCDRNGYRI